MLYLVPDLLHTLQTQFKSIRLRFGLVCHLRFWIDELELSIKFAFARGIQKRGIRYTCDQRFAAKKDCQSLSDWRTIAQSMSTALARSPQNCLPNAKKWHTTQDLFFNGPRSHTWLMKNRVLFGACGYALPLTRPIRYLLCMSVSSIRKNRGLQTLYCAGNSAFKLASQGYRWHPMSAIRIQHTLIGD